MEPYSPWHRPPHRPGVLPGGQVWRSHKAIQLLAVGLGYIPPYLFAILSYFNGWDLGLSRLFYTFVVGTLELALVLLVLRFLCGENLSSLNLKPGRWRMDLQLGAYLLLAHFYVLIFFQCSSARLPGAPVETDAFQRAVYATIASQPLLLAFFLGPVTWVSVAGFEEISRAFFFSRVLRLWPAARKARWAAVLFSALLFGAAHLYQGPLSALANGITAVIDGLFYLMVGRLLPLIFAHGLFDSIVLVVNLVLLGG
jgi:membrane protease YdiL (CAAX protease family)